MILNTKIIRTNKLILEILVDLIGFITIDLIINLKIVKFL